MVGRDSGWHFDLLLDDHSVIIHGNEVMLKQGCLFLILFVIFLILGQLS